MSKKKIYTVDELAALIPDFGGVAVGLELDLDYYSSMDPCLDRVDAYAGGEITLLPDAGVGIGARADHSMIVEAPECHGMFGRDSVTFGDY